MAGNQVLYSISWCIFAQRNAKKNMPVNPRLSTTIQKTLAEKVVETYNRINKYAADTIIGSRGTTAGGTVDYTTDSRAIAARIKAELNPLTVKDINGYGVGEGTEYKFFTSSLNLPRGVDPSQDFRTFIQQPVWRKLQYYAIINSKIKATILKDFQDYFKLDWFSGIIPSEKIDVSTAIAKRLNDISIHLEGLKLSIAALSLSAASGKVLETSEIITRTALSIASIIPVSRPLGVAGNLILGQQDARDSLALQQKANDINRDAKLLELEANQLLELYNSKSDKPKLTDSLLDNSDSQLRSAVLEENTLYIILVLVALVILYRIYKRRNGKQKRKK